MAEHDDPVEEGLNEVMDSCARGLYYSVSVEMLE